MNKGAVAIELRSICKTYLGDVKPIDALRGVDLTVMCGEHVAIMGPSGSGKSTLLAILGCLDRPDSGGHWCFGSDISKLSLAQLAQFRNSSMGFVFQNLSLLPRMSVLENVALPFEYSAKSRTEAIALASEALDRVGMLGRVDYLPRQLSGGQQQRIAVARAIVNNPRLLLADEPTGALDKTSAEEIISLLASLRSENRTVIVVSHDPDIAKHADRVLAFDDGRFRE